MLKKITISIIIVFHIGLISYSQNFNSINYNVDNTPQMGPGNNIILDIAQDKEGNLWFATGSGVSKYDGQSWSVFMYDSPYDNGQDNDYTCIITDTNSNVYMGNWGRFGLFSKIVDDHIEIIRYIHVYNMVVDDSNNIWIAAAEGLFKYKSDNFIEIIPYNTFISEPVYAIDIDKNNKLWLGTENGVWFQTDTAWQNITTDDGLLDNYVFYILSDSQNNIWMMSELGLNKYDGSQWEYYTTEDGLVDDIYWNMSIDHNDNLYFSTEWNALIKFDGNEFTTISDTIGLAGNSVLSCFEDKYSNLWIGMWAVGVDKYDGSTFTNFSGNSLDWVEKLMYKDSKLYIGTTRGGLTVFDGENWETHNISNGFISNSVYDIDVDHEGNIWFATFWGLTKYDGENFTDYTFFDGIFGNSLTTVHVDNYNNVWVGFAYYGAAMYDGNNWTYYDSTNSPLLRRVEKIYQDNNDTYWFSTVGGEYLDSSKLLSFDGETWKRYQPIEGYVSSILQDSKGNIWFGYAGFMLQETIAKFDGVTWQTYVINNDNRGVFDIYEDKDSVIWFARNLNGCTTFDGENWVNYTYEDNGFPRQQNKTITQDINGDMWIGTYITGLYKIIRETGIIEQQQPQLVNGFEIFPNPVTDYFTIRSTKEYMTTKKAEIYSSEGKLILEKEFHFEVNIDIKDYPAGVYIVKVSNRKLSYSSKIVKK